MSTSAVLEKSVAVTCRATKEQFLIRHDQVQLIKRFLKLGNSPEFQAVKESILEHVFGRQAWRHDWWNQTMILLALRVICPEGFKIDSFGQIEQTWKEFVSHTEEYEHFFEMLGVPKVHRAHNKENSLPHWFLSQSKLTQFIGELRVKKYRPLYWASLATPW